MKSEMKKKTSTQVVRTWEEEDEVAMSDIILFIKLSELIQRNVAHREKYS